MRRLLWLSPLLLAACATRPAAAGNPGSRRDAGPHLQGRAGQPVSSASPGPARPARRSCARPMPPCLRWAPPGMMMTMEYRADRVTVCLDAAERKITKITLRLGRFADHPRFDQRPADGRQAQARALGDGESVDRLDRPLRGPVIAVQPLGHEPQRFARNVQPAVGEEQLDQPREQRIVRDARSGRPE